MNRREFLASAAATALAPLAAAAPAAPDVLTPPPEVLPAAPAAEFGYSADGELWHGDFSSHAEAIEAALDYCDGPFTTAQISYRQIAYPGSPGFAEDVVDWLYNAGAGQTWYDLGDLLAERLAGYNQDNDFEGDFEVEVHRHSSVLTEPAQRIVGAALRRAGAEAIAGYVETRLWSDATVELPDAVAEAVSADTQLHDDLLAIVTDWVERYNLQASLRSLDLDDQRDHGGRQET